jgi:hypothetical protein
MHQELSFIDLDREHGELLPARETLLFGNYNWTAIHATNSSLAFNAASAFSQANSQAVQQIAVSQG